MLEQHSMWERSVQVMPLRTPTGTAKVKQQKQT